MQLAFWGQSCRLQIFIFLLANVFLLHPMTFTNNSFAAFDLLPCALAGFEPGSPALQADEMTTQRQAAGGGRVVFD
jgi:hypothetical protein